MCTAVSIDHGYGGVEQWTASRVLVKHEGTTFSFSLFPFEWISFSVHILLCSRSDSRIEAPFVTQIQGSYPDHLLLLHRVGSLAQRTPGAFYITRLFSPVRLCVCSLFFYASPPLNFFLSVAEPSYGA